MEQFGTVFGKNRRPRPSDAVCPAHDTGPPLRRAPRPHIIGQTMNTAQAASGPEAAASPEENLARLRRRQNRYLPKMMRLCAAAHPYYAPLMERLGLADDDFRTVEDLRKLPPLPKKEYARDPEAFRMDLKDVPDLTPEETTLADIVYTAGSTSKPAPFYDTVHDRFARVQLMGRAAAIAGVGPDDTVMNLFPLSSVPHQGFLSASWGAMASGAKLLAGITGRAYPDIPVHRRMDQAVQTAERQKATVLWGITTYVRRFVMRAQELGMDFSSVRLAMVMGEPCPPYMRQDIRSRLMSMGSKDPSTNNGYGLTETQGPAMECVELGGMHQPSPEQFFFEVVDRETGEPLPDGEPGMMLVSHLNRRGTVLLRYVGGDVVALSHETCPNCGRAEPRFLGTPRRADGFTKVKGTLINLGSLQDSLAAMMGRGIAEYQIVLTTEDPSDTLSPDVMLLKIACAPENRHRIGAEAKALVRNAAEITPRIEFLPADGFAEIAGGYKFKRVTDERERRLLGNE